MTLFVEFVIDDGILFCVSPQQSEPPAGRIHDELESEQLNLMLNKLRVNVNGMDCLYTNFKHRKMPTALHPALIRNRILARRGN